MTMGDSWSYVPHDHYKSTTKLVQLLVKIVSRGGNFLLNVGPSPDGDWDDTAYARLKEIGTWLDVNGEGIYSSRTIYPWSSGNVYLTQAKDSSAVYAFVLGEGENRDISPAAEIVIEKFTAKPKSIVTILGRKGRLKWRQEGKKMIIEVPPGTRGEYALTLKITKGTL
jgi:alpha-L-fucosidase